MISSTTPGGERDSLAVALPAARLAFPARGRPAASNVCLCHRTRMRVIKAAQAQRLRKDRPTAYLTLEGEKPLGQRLFIYAGAPLIACVQATRDGVFNSMLLEVTGFDGETVSLKDREGDAEFRLPHAWVAKHTRSGLCYTISSAQGHTISAELGIFETDHPR